MIRERIRGRGGRDARVFTFESLADMVAHADTVRNPAMSSSRDGDAGFSGSATWAECVAHSHGDGWTVAHMIDNVAATVAPVLARVESRKMRTVASVAGPTVNVGRYVAGHPVAARAVVKRADMAPARVVRVLVNVAVAGNVPAATMTANGATVLAALWAIRRAGVAVELWAAISCKGVRNPAECVSLTRLAEAGRAPDEEAVMFGLAHPGFLRRVFFAVEEGEAGTDPEWGQHMNTGIGYGLPVAVPADILARVGADVVIGAEMARPMSDGQRAEWLADIIRAAGITLG